ncbi:MAG TPA: hypothetical protein H9874_00940 [Candidatus Bilophila faecipullorum]|uniref:Uncharacterized protein n=1 Tax=Candidatus Bilophila faecipullorum TaxID=2838482 RepID=A0A9D1U839_9BACT|nr:hypothetical protein [Candidatus Bilophila faecipullorum]
MCGSRSCASFKPPLKVFWRTAAGSAVTLCALTAALHGCAGAGALTGVPPAPATPGAIVTGEWSYAHGGGTVGVPGEWVHLPAREAGELQLWIEHAEDVCR